MGSKIRNLGSIPLLRRIGILLLALSPLAFGVAVWRAPQVDAPARWQLGLSRDDAVETARQALEQLLAVEIGGQVEASVWVEYDVALERYLDRRAAEAGTHRAVAAVQRLAPPLVIAVEMPLSFGGKAVVRLARDGRVLGYDLPSALAPEDDSEEADPKDDEARRAERASSAAAVDSELRPEVVAAYARRQAAEAHQLWLRGLEVALRETESESAQTASGVRTFTWRERLEVLPELEVSLQVELENRQLRHQSVRARLEADSDSQLGSGLPMVARAVAGTLWGLLLLWLIVRGLLRYGYRFSESEVSHPRTLLLSLAMLLTSVPFSHQLFTAFRIGDADDAWPLVLVTSLLLVLPVSVLLALLWAGCEADLRQIDRRRLLSLDAVVRGLWGRREVAWSILVGAGCASWLLALRSLLPALVPDGTLRLATPLQPAILLLGGGWLYGPALACITALPLLVFGLVVPLAYLRRRPRLALLLGSLTNFLGLLLLREITSVPWQAALLDAAVWTLAIVLPYLLADLLAAVCGHVLAWVGLYLICLAHQPADDLSRLALLLLAGIGLGLAVQAAVVRFGRRTPAEEVMPRYVRKMRERESLAEEVSAATVARDRLLPVTPPQPLGAALSVVTVSGQQAGAYHDFFELPEGVDDEAATCRGERRVGLVVADFGWGLAAALRLTLAKGFLLSFHRRQLPPEALVRRLLGRLGQLVTLRDQEDEAAVVFADYAPSQRRLCLALARHSPLLVLLRADRRAEILAGFDTRHTAVLERESRAEVVEMEVQLEPGDALAVVLLGDVDLERWWGRLRRRLRSCLEGGPSADAAALAQRMRDVGVEPVTVVQLRVEDPEATVEIPSLPASVVAAATPELAPDREDAP